jgi:hypothetical protein
MKKTTKRLLGGVALAAAAAGAIGALMIRSGKQKPSRRRPRNTGADVWARPGMKVTFRAEVMPGRERSERTFEVTTLLPSGRVLLAGASGEHAEKEFERLR